MIHGTHHSWAIDMRTQRFGPDGNLHVAHRCTVCGVLGWGDPPVPERVLRAEDFRQAVF